MLKPEQNLYSAGSCRITCQKDKGIAIKKLRFSLVHQGEKKI
jgi:hypothetical protein